MSTNHPCLDENNRIVTIAKPSAPSPISYWYDPGAIAIVIPASPLPATLNGITLLPWSAPPAEATFWQAMVASPASNHVEVPPFIVPNGKKPAAGAVIVEPDNRAWVIHPTNAFGGYQATFPKGKVDKGWTLEATALREAYEECGLQIALTGWLVDVPRSTSVCRYFLARRLGGSPAAMGWESQAVSLVPLARLPEVIHHNNDQPILEALRHALFSS